MASSESPYAKGRENNFRELVRRLEHSIARDNSVEYENVVRMCVEQVQGIRSIKQLSGLQSREAETLLDVLRRADASKLRELDLSKTLITGSVVQILSDVLSTTRFAALEVLNLSENLHCQMDMTSSAALAEVLASGCLPHLRVLCLPPCHVPTIAAAMLRGNISRLEELRMEFYRKLMQSSSELKNFFEEGPLSALRILGLRDCISTEDQIEQFMRRVKSGDLMKLECLDFSNNFLNYKGCKFLARAIQSGQLCQLRHLDLSWCKLGDSGVQQILDGIDQTPLLETLCLESNSFTDVATASLAQAMKKRKLVNIRKIRVHGRNMISNQGIVALSTVLSDSTCVPKLDTLDFGEDKTLDLIGAKALRDAYRQNPNLTVFVNVSWPDESLKIQMQEQRVNNMRAEELKLEDEEQVVPRMAKVFLCGYEKVGKTTLRRSMERNLLKSFITWERRPKFHEEPRTRGIELSEASGEAGTAEEELTLILWELAGQQEFHVMHGALLSDLGLASGKATTFVLVFRADLVKLPEAAKSERELRYWLRFIAAGSAKGIKRHLVLALNCINSRIHGGVEAEDFNLEDHSYHTDLDLVIEIMNLVEGLCVQTCPSVELERKAIGPWRADRETVPMAYRKLIPVDELKMHVRKHGLHSSTTMTVETVGLQSGQLLSASELEAIHSSVKESILIAQSDIKKFDLLPPSSLPVADETEEALKQDETQGDTEKIIFVIREEGHRMREHIDRKCEELQKKFDKAFECQKKLLNQILALNRYSIEEKENYPYSKTVVWMCDECFNCYQPTGRVRDITNYFDRVKPSASVWL
ncbi:hypothetical protein AXG93_2829s1000 [Marchantia polymorpha subsp. ruderalis]|uniref:C-terminal of Roc (COR) domain-containing protein n=1 Tax=Marchantia polymorpha subsp. ruderalis TaxID=1480154 RepID=A0A176VVL2_MARPO|nr:hypothetical protein AXG93_2829s1000 [Marchantia polymorpha subsp. ruderalis]